MNILEDVKHVVIAIIHVLTHSALNFLKLFVPKEYLFKDIKDDIVLITGGGSGIGRLMSLDLARRGATIVTWDVNTTGNEETVEKIKAAGGKAYSFTVDITNRDAVYQLAAEVKQKIGDITILVNNAGIVSGSYILDTNDRSIVKTLEVNSIAHFWTIKAFLPRMIEKKRGHIVTVASLAGLSGNNKLVDYCSSKFAAVGLDEALRVELYAQGYSDFVKTTCVCPYFISTGMFEGVQSKLIPILKPEDVADQAVAGILRNKELVLIPGWTIILILLKYVLPTDAAMSLSKVFGLNQCMDDFKGRKKSD